MNFTKYAATLALLATTAYAGGDDQTEQKKEVKTDTNADKTDVKKVEKVVSAANGQFEAINKCIDLHAKDEKPDNFKKCLEEAKVATEHVEVLVKNLPKEKLTEEKLLELIPAAPAAAPVVDTPWYKSTGFMIGAGLVAVVALGAGGYFMFAKKDAEEL